jgi:predicted permease
MTSPDPQNTPDRAETAGALPGSAEHQTSLFDGLRQDLRYTARTLRRDAGFTVFAILIVGLGVGASSTVFSVANALLIRPLPFRDPGQLMWITNRDSSGLSGRTTQVSNLLDLREQNQSFSELAAYFAFYGVGDSKLTRQGQAERLSAVPVSQNFFPLLGVQPELGRQFTPNECTFNGPKVVMLSHGVWQRRFASDPGIVGRALTLNDEAVTVVGVLPSTFDFSSVFAPASHIDLFVPFPLTPETNRWGNTLAIIGRLKPGVPVRSAASELRAVAQQITRAHPDRNSFEGNLTTLAEHVSGQTRPALIVLGCAVGVVMLIVCANLSNLLLARTAGRQKEMAIRAALGAGRGRLVRQMLTESVALSCCGAVLGLGVAFAGTRALAHLDAISIPLLQSVRLDMNAVAFTIAMAVLAGIAFGLTPALQSPVTALHESLKETARGSTEGRKRKWIRSVLVVSEIAFACVLLVGAGLLIRSLLQVLDVDMGFQPQRTAALRVDPDRRFTSQEEQNAYFGDLLRRIREVPGIEAAGLTDALPLGRNRSWGIGVKGRVFPPGQNPNAFVRIVSDGYVKAMGIRVLAGRELSFQDSVGVEPVIMVNETLARRLWPGEDAIGKFMRADKERRIVGVVADVRHLALEQNAGLEMYLPILQTQGYASVDLVVRTTLAPAAMASSVRAALLPIEPNLPANEFRPLQQLVDKAVSPRRFVVLLLGGFAVFALVLASLGIYAVVSYSVSQRTQEIGIRMALGASATELQRRIVLQTLGLAAVGIVLGTAASWALARLLSGFLFGVTASDPMTFAGMAVTLVLTGVMAGYVPARRASRIDPMVALRSS